ncbi:hypothetical protein OAP83_00235 [Rickettsiales bacterium]|nr:hypothetical protein [Rickettsiales bacterium]
MRSFSDVNDHTSVMINAILLGDYNTAGSILSSNYISLTVMLGEKTTIEHVLLSENSELINLFIEQYKDWNLSDTIILPSLINTIYNYFSTNPHHEVTLHFSSDSDILCEVSRLAQLTNLSVDIRNSSEVIPIIGSITASLGKNHQDPEFDEPSSPSNWSLMKHIEDSPRVGSFNYLDRSLNAAEAYSEGEITLTSGAQANSADMAAEEISNSQVYDGLSDLGHECDQFMMFEMDEEELEKAPGF